ncbi:HAD family phosphatase [Bacteroides sp. OttesenSCG-928-F21]|nr:HAD family phosphatase [Bacteroides sp. OttesenSCG-928-F21]
MNATKVKAALFDFDGVVMDTEPQYTVFWDEQGLKYLDIVGFGRQIKGQTLKQIYEKHFAGKEDVQQQITGDLKRYEEQMSYEFLPGVVAFLTDLGNHGVKKALVTSSNEEKMANVYRAHPVVGELFDKILTAEYFTRSKPHPECFLLGMQLFDAAPEETVVFEDSFHGLQAGTDSGATVYGLATTNSREEIQDKAHYIIDDFTGMTYHKLILKS